MTQHDPAPEVTISGPLGFVLAIPLLLALAVICGIVMLMVAAQALAPSSDP